jgi:hypothetical protein
MNPYTTMGQARIRRRDIARTVGRDWYLATGSLAALERQRTAHADAELDGLLKQHRGEPHAAPSFVALLRQIIRAALIRACTGLVGTSRLAAAPQSVPERAGSG